MAKRTFDFLFSSFLLIILSPLLIFISLFIKLHDGGSVFYMARRVGLHGRIFRMYKFRTMVVNADKVGPSSTANDDTRLTNVGKFLRKYKLDEIPQLINVFKGEMSFVGPRPQVEWVVKLYSEEEKKVLSVRPGITDYASIRFHNEGEILAGSSDPDKAYFEKIHPEKMRLAMEYVKKQSLLVDFKIILQTFLSVFK